MTLGAQAIVIGNDNEILLIRHGYRPGWFFPGGGVEWNETLRQALARERMEETGIETAESPELHGVYANFQRFPGDHIALFIVRKWERPTVPKPSAEIAESAFFPLNRLPDGIDTATRRRLAELFEGRSADQSW